MKKLIFILSFFVCISAYSQSFNGVAISGDVENTIAELKLKGFKFVKKSNVAYEMEGKLALENVELYVYATPITNQTAKIVIYFPERNSFHKLKEDYERYLDILTTKYGNPTKKYFLFVSPYYEGDGYELQAIKNDKGIVASMWLSINNLSLSVSISEYSQLKLTYENDKNMEKLQDENKRKDLIVF